MRIMISSTAKDLPEYREAVINACRCCGFDLEVMEDFPASDSNAIDASLKMVDECDIYLGILLIGMGTSRKVAKNRLQRWNMIEESN